MFLRIFYLLALIALIGTPFAHASSLTALDSAVVNPFCTQGSNETKPEEENKQDEETKLPRCAELPQELVGACGCNANGELANSGLSLCTELRGKYNIDK